MFNDSISTPRHFLGYSASDQRTVRELVNFYDGLLVPGTIATFQREGTAGFVLTLSARGGGPPYVIDPRFPLFQQPLTTEKVSHTALAKILGDQSLVTKAKPRPEHFTSERIDNIAAAWVEFNLGYRSQQSAKFVKYAKRLGEPLEVTDAAGPQRVLAPYFSASGRDDPWWEKAIEFYEATVRAAGGRVDVTRVLAAKNTRALSELVDEPGTDDICIWVSGLEELGATSEALGEYANSLGRLHQSGRRTFALYGGFFAVMLSALGLGGCSHGIGYGEHRRWRELPQSGPPPSRYYIPTIHRYASQDDAQFLWNHDQRLISEIATAPPTSLAYHDLKKHSVRARSGEIDCYGPLNLTSTIARLETEYREFRERLRRGRPSRFVLSTGKKLIGHIPTWLDALERLV